MCATRLHSKIFATHLRLCVLSQSLPAMPELSRISKDSALPPNVTGTVVTVGTFDGVHRGHLDVLSRLVSRSNATGLPSVLVSFDPHPLEVVNPTAAPLLLTSLDEKLEVIGEAGIDYFAVVPF